MDKASESAQWVVLSALTLLNRIIIIIIIIKGIYIAQVRNGHKCQE